MQVGDHNTQHIHLAAPFPGNSAVVMTIHADPGAEIFVGRAEQVAHLLDVLSSADEDSHRPAVCAVQGMGGIGKTALTRQVAAQAVGRDWFAGGAVFVDLHGYDPLPTNRIVSSQVFAPALRALGVPADQIPADAAQQPTAWHQHLDVLARQGRRVLVVLDNVAEPAQIQDLLPTPMAARHHRVLITSRDTLALPDADRVELDVLAPEEARTLLVDALDRPARVRGLARDPRLEAEAIADILRWCGRLPLAVAIAAGVLAEEPDLAIGELVADLADRATRLAVLDDGAGGVHAAFRTSWLRLRTRDPEAARLLCLLTAGPGPDIGLPAAAALLDVSESTARVRLRVLTRAHLLLGGPRRWAFHDLLRLDVGSHAVPDLAITEADLAAATDRVLGHYLTTTRAALDWMATVRAPVPAPTGNLFAGWEDGLAWLDTERACLVDGAVLAAETGRDRLAVGLALALAGVLSWRRQVADWITVARVADRAARRLSDVPLTLRAIENLGTALVEARRFTEAIDQLSTARLLGRLYFDDLAVEARVRDSLGLALQGIGDFSQAAHEHSTAIGIFQEIGDRHREGAAWSNFGTAVLHLGELPRAVEAHAEAGAIFQEIGDRHSEAMARGNLAGTFHALSWRDAAITELLAALQIFRDIGDRHGQAQALTNLGLILRESQRFDESATAFIAAAYWHSQLGDRRGEASAWRDLQRTYLAADRPDHARRAAQRATSMGEADDIGDVEASERVLRGWRVHAEHGTGDLPQGWG